MADSLLGVLKALVDSDPRTAGLEFTQGMGKPRPAAIYAVAKLKSWTPSYQSSTSTWYDARVEIRLHAPKPEEAEAAAALVQAVLAPERPGIGPALDWSTGGTSPPLNVVQRREQVKGYVAGANFQAVHCLEVLYKATGFPGAEGVAAGIPAFDPGDAPPGADVGGFDDATFDDSLNTGDDAGPGSGSGSGSTGTDAPAAGAAGFDDGAFDDSLNTGDAVPAAPASAAGTAATPPAADAEGFDVGGFDDPTS